MSAGAARVILAPVSVGELIDKITILEIKNERISEPSARGNVQRELEALRALRDRESLPAAVLEIADALSEANRQLWDIENALRHLEREGCFDADFIALARQVYAVNDRRAALKRQVNALSNSAIVEEKHYRSDSH
ncbi:DUF6165 family protein [Xanthobacter pseudotagetidis]|uniref:DUF6165 family protein n=1 Tax=Xanthobacter pseudotagetidis TaxID=3119911 RepID=UPI003728E829